MSTSSPSLILILCLLVAQLVSHAEAANPKNCTQVNCGASNCCHDSYLGPVCYDTKRYACPSEGNNFTLCGVGLSSCGGTCFDTKAYRCVSGVITSRPPVLTPPTPSPQFPIQTADVRIINNCKSTLWIEARQGPQSAPLPGVMSTSTMALPGSFVDYTIPSTGLSSARFWAKYGCDKNGKDCSIGDQSQYWPSPPGGCPAKGCTAPIDSLFEATFGCKPGASCNNQNPTTWFDTSQVDGWTIPYKLTTSGATEKCDCNGRECAGFKGVDASRLDLSRCPSSEDLTLNGTHLNAVVDGQNYALSSVDLRVVDPSTAEVLGCMSPCKKLSWQMGLSEGKDSALWMCCPTPSPSDCNVEDGCVTPQQCRDGPIEKTSYVSAVHDMAPGVYSYSYDDLMGLHSCPSGTVVYTMEFCPTGSSPYPGVNK